MNVILRDLCDVLDRLVAARRSDRNGSSRFIVRLDLWRLHIYEWHFHTDFRKIVKNG